MLDVPTISRSPLTSAAWPRQTSSQQPDTAAASFLFPFLPPPTLNQAQQPMKSFEFRNLVERNGTGWLGLDEVKLTIGIELLGTDHQPT